MAKNNKKNKLAFPVGIIAFIFAVIGMITVVSMAVNGIKKIADNSAKKEEYEKFLKPVVMFDPDPFDDLTKAEPSQLLNCAVWALLMSENGVDGYPYSEGETVGIIVPQEDLEKYFIELFGTEIDIASLHSSIDMSGYGISYDAALKSYILPVTGVESAYVPKVYSIEKQGNSLILNVGYIGNKAFADINSDNYQAPDPDKLVKITLRERDGGMYVSSIQNTSNQEIASAAIGTRVYEYVTEEETTIAAPVEEITTEPITDERGSIVEPIDGEEATVEESTSEIVLDI